MATATFPADNLALLQQQVKDAHVSHAARPYVLGPFAEAYGLWRKLYEARAALADQNPAFASQLLPSLAPIAGKVPGLPVLPAGIRWAVDEAAPGTIVVTLDIAGTVTLKVTPPDGVSFTPPVVSAPTRQTTTFDARADGLYTLVLKAGGSYLTTIYVPVQRARFRDFRELSRALAFGFTPSKNPAATDTYSELLAVLIACDAAAATGQPDLFAQLSGLADQLEKAPHPVALFPNG